ncbi:thioredoxin-like protein TxlA [Prochlorococcus marinus str. MIT 9515]|uniref:Thioredoxin-like protein TxlA n=2 Tax=Prochlorococcus marinus TaxID=1219 RepID=A2BUM3_PROM5|nr:thioredoxin-like protein TxlA [Prochlorococcus marinus str. MIT 9515]
MMQSGNKESFLNLSQKSILILSFTLIIGSLLLFKNLVFQPNFLLKKFGELTIDPEIAFTNKKPTFLEFYAEWCEVCKEMAPSVADIKEEYEKDINFVFLNVDNPKWEKYIRNFNVNGIPQVNLFDEDANLEVTFIGKQQEKTIKESLDNLYEHSQSNLQILNTEFSKIRDNKNYQTSPRSHG